MNNNIDIGKLIAFVRAVLYGNNQGLIDATLKELGVDVNHLCTCGGNITVKMSDGSDICPSCGKAKA